MTPPPDEVDVASRIAATVQIWATIAGALAIVWGFLVRVYKPLVMWRREHQARVIREVLAPELRQLKEFAAHEDSCVGQMETVLEKLREFFGDHDSLISISIDNRERLDENNDFLDALGFTSRERRTDEERRKIIDDLVSELGRRSRARRRGIADAMAVSTKLHPPPPPE